MPSHELAAIIGIVAIWATLGAFFAGYYFAKRKSKKHVEKLAEKIVEIHSKNHESEQNKAIKTDDSVKPDAKKFDWL